MIKNTSLVFTIGVYEMFSDAEIHYSQTFKPVEFFGAVAIWYLLLTGIWSIIQAQIERKLSASERADELSFRERMMRAWAPVEAWARGAR
jgi:polar amino acid transport system permease protein